VNRALVITLVAACGGSSHPTAATKAPNDQLIVGDFERRPPDGTTAARFRADGTIAIAHDKSKLDGETLATGHWKLDGDKLELVYDQGMCAGVGPGSYQVVVSRLGIHFKMLDDACEQRQKLDGQVWRRIP
jgi:hypothetical protein